MNLISRAASLLILLSLGCGSKDAVIYIEVPDGFVGEIIFKEGAAGQSGFFKDGQYVYKVQSPGVTEVSSIRPFQRWHSLVAKTVSGESLLDGGTSVSPRTESYIINYEEPEKEATVRFSVTRVKGE